MKQVDIVWEPEAERFIGTGAGGREVVVNAPHAADPDRRTGISPADLLLVAAGTCSAWDVVEILRKQRQAIDGVEVRVKGEQQAEPPWTFQSIVLEFTIRGRNVNREMAERAVRLSEEKYCSVTSTLRRGTSVSSTLEVVDAAAGAGVAASAPAATGEDAAAIADATAGTGFDPDGRAAAATAETAAGASVEAIQATDAAEAADTRGQ